LKIQNQEDLRQLGPDHTKVKFG